MLLLLAIVLNGLLLLLATLFLGLFWTICIVFVYVTFTFARGAHETGHDAFERLRSIYSFSSILKVRQVDPLAFNEDSRYIFIVIPNASNASLVYGFGLHGNPEWIKLRLCYLMPNVLFYIPILREALLLSGAVSANNNADERVIDMIRRGRNVAYAPNGMEDALFVHEHDKISAKKPSMSLFEKAVARDYEIVPCMCSGENDQKYMFLTSKLIRDIQGWFLKHIGYPFPLVYIPRGRDPIDMNIGVPIHTKGRKAHDVQTDFFNSLKALNNNGVAKTLSLKE